MYINKFLRFLLYFALYTFELIFTNCLFNYWSQKLKIRNFTELSKLISLLVYWSSFDNAFETGK